jgi:hypothetical protein
VPRSRAARLSETESEPTVLSPQGPQPQAADPDSLNLDAAQLRVLRCGKKVPRGGACGQRRVPAASRGEIGRDRGGPWARNSNAEVYAAYRFRGFSRGGARWQWSWPLHSKVERTGVSVLTRSDVWAGELRSVRPLAGRAVLVLGTVKRDPELETGAPCHNSKNASGVGAPTRAAAGAPLPPSRTALHNSISPAGPSGLAIGGFRR